MTGSAPASGLDPFSEEFLRDPYPAHEELREAGPAVLPPVQTFFRTTTRDVAVDGAEVPAGEKVLLFLAAANRDPRHWEEPIVPADR